MTQPAYKPCPHCAAPVTGCHQGGTAWFEDCEHEPDCLLARFQRSPEEFEAAWNERPVEYELEIRALAALQRAAHAEHRLHSYRQGNSARSKARAELVKAQAPELWPAYAAVSVNGSVYSEDLTLEPVYERDMNVLRHRAERAEQLLAALTAQPDWWEVALRAHAAQHGAGGQQWNISALLDRLRAAAPRE